MPKEPKDSNQRPDEPDSHPDGANKKKAERPDEGKKPKGSGGQGEGKKQRKTRSDKGEVEATDRDLYCMEWIADQYAARFDQIQKLLSRVPDPKKPYQGEMLAETTTKDLIDRWRRAGWIEYRRVLAADRGFAWVTRRGLQLVELDGLYTAKEPAAIRLNHIYAINQVRLWMDGAGYQWTSEREYIASLKKKKKKDEKVGPIPDAVVFNEKLGKKAALEIELTAKKPATMFLKVARLVREIQFDAEVGNYAPVFPLIWFYVPNEQIKKLVEGAVADLRDKGERERVSCGVDPTLLRVRRG